MKHKKHIKILGMRYKLKRVNPDSEELVIGDNMRCYAVVDHINNLICVSEDSSKDRLQNSILHEILHAVDIELRLGLSHKTINRLASGLHSAGVHIDV